MHLANDIRAYPINDLQAASVRYDVRQKRQQPKQQSPQQKPMQQPQQQQQKPMGQKQQPPRQPPPQQPQRPGPRPQVQQPQSQPHMRMRQSQQPQRPMQQQRPQQPALKQQRQTQRTIQAPRLQQQRTQKPPQKNQSQTQYGKNDDSWMPREAFVPGMRTAKYSSDPSKPEVFWNNEAHVGFETERGGRQDTNFLPSAGGNTRVKGHSDVRGPEDHKERITDVVGEIATDLYFAPWDQVGKGAKAVKAKTHAAFNKVRAHFRGGGRRG
ncbi:hypothetical protein AAVH_19202 [Aphelenchoides avenae]|nr:hypothetical protein AAVH_19202 [Aphelenchus avenae]